jgi:monovalent cation/hydrogen antiporter
VTGHVRARRLAQAISFRSGRYSHTTDMRPAVSFRPMPLAAMTFHTSEIYVGLMVVVAIVSLASNKLKIPYPIMLVLAGLGLSVIPGLPPAEIDPDIIFLVFLPPLLYFASLLTTWRDFKANIRPIMLLAVGLVLVTMVAVALVSHWMIPGMTLGAAFLLGAIVSPPDAIAATTVLERLSVPKRVVTILEGESLVNDATALVAYQIAIGIVISGADFDLGWATLQTLYVAVGGIVIGLVAALGIATVIKRVSDPHVEVIISLLSPFIAYLPAHWVGASGVLAAVAAGLYIARRLPDISSSATRIRGFAVWETVVYLMNGFVFVLIGLQLQSIAARLSQISLGTLCYYGMVVSVTAIVVRMIWVPTLAYASRLVPAVRRNEPKPSARQVALISWAGMRGIVSLACALAIPMYVDDKHTRPFPDRDLIIFLAFAVILVTLVFQGLTLAPLIRWLGLTDDGTTAREEREARIEAAHAAVARLEVMTIMGDYADPVLQRVQAEYDGRLARLGAARPEELPGPEQADLDRQLISVKREALAAERRMITFLRDKDVIADEVLRRLLSEVDLEDARMAAAAAQMEPVGH